MKLSIILTSFIALAASAAARKPHRYYSGSPSATYSPTTISNPTSTTCTTTLFKPVPTLNLDPTTTIFPSTVTATSKVDCGGCALAFTSIRLGPGPVRIITATVTAAEPTTTTTTVCASHHSKE